MAAFEGINMDEDKKQNGWLRKIIILWIVVAVFFALMGCEQEKPPRAKTAIEMEAESGIKRVQHGDVSIVVIDGCEYIIYKETNGNNQGYGYMAHKGNCKNPIHRHNQTAPPATEP